MSGNLTIHQHNETDYIITLDLGTSHQIRLDNTTMYLLESRPGVEFADFRDNKIYIKVFNIIHSLCLYVCLEILGLCDVAQPHFQHSVASPHAGPSQ